MGSLFISRKVAAESGGELAQILSRAPRKLDILEFTPDVKPTPAQLASIEAAFYSRDIWEGTIKTRLERCGHGVLADRRCRAEPASGCRCSPRASIRSRTERTLERGIRVTTSAGANAEPVGLTAVTGLMMLARGFPHWMRAQQKREWSPQLGADSPPDLPGQTVLIVGMGHIGKVIARVLHAVGMRVIGVRRNVAPAENFNEVLPLSALDAVLPKCDWLVLACPLTRKRAVSSTSAASGCCRARPGSSTCRAAKSSTRPR